MINSHSAYYQKCFTLEGEKMDGLNFQKVFKAK